MRLARVRPDEDHRLAVVHVVVGVGHGAVTPGVRHARHRGGVADARLVIDVVGAPVGGKLAEQIGLLVAVLGGTQPVDGVRTGLLSNLQHVVANLVDGLVPADPFPLAVLELGRILQPTLADAVLAHGRALGAVRA